jgi:hypothetical protein
MGRISPSAAALMSNRSWLMSLVIDDRLALPQAPDQAGLSQHEGLHDLCVGKAQEEDVGLGEIGRVGRDRNPLVVELAEEAVGAVVDDELRSALEEVVGDGPAHLPETGKPELHLFLPNRAASRTGSRAGRSRDPAAHRIRMRSSTFDFLCYLHLP